MHQKLKVLQPLQWCCVKCVIHHERHVCEEQHHTYVWCEQATIEFTCHDHSNLSYKTSSLQMI